MQYRLNLQFYISCLQKIAHKCLFVYMLQHGIRSHKTIDNRNKRRMGHKAQIVLIVITCLLDWHDVLDLNYKI